VSQVVKTKGLEPLCS